MVEDTYYIDPNRYRFRNAFRRLTAVRFLVFAARIVGRIFHFIFEAFFRFIRFVGIFLLDALYSFKMKSVDIKYNSRRERINMCYFSSRISAFVREAVQRGKAGIQEETRALAAPKRQGMKPTLLWSALNFALVLIVIIIPIVAFAHVRTLSSLKFKILASTESAFSHLFSAKDLLEKRDIPGAQTAFSEASKNFIDAQADLASINSILLDIAGAIPNKSLRLAASSRHIIEAGKLSSELGQTLSGALVLPPGESPSALNFLNNFVRVAEPSISTARQLEKEIGAVDSDSLPVQYKKDFESVAAKAAFLSKSLEEAVALASQAQSFLGEKMDRRYLLVFQNNSEKRGSGGFIGSFALVDMRRGEIARLTVPAGGSYDTEAGLKRRIAAPKPLRLLRPQWFFWDANWWPDWPTSAKKLMWFYEKSDGPTVDGVISLTPTVLENILRVIGPIDLTKDYGVIINADNFWSVTQQFSEQKPQVTKEPKKIIGDLLDAILVEVPKRLTPEMTIQLIAVIEKSLNEKHIMAYVNDSLLESSINRLGWGGAMSSVSGDYLMIANTNIGGQKTDRVIKENYDHQAEILPDGSIIDTITIQRHHTGIKGDLFTGVRNVNWLRVYVPKGSSLLSVSGFSPLDSKLIKSVDPNWEHDADLKEEENAVIQSDTGTHIYNEGDKTVFANWSLVDPGQSVSITLRYKLPFSLPLPEHSDHWLSDLKKFIWINPAPAYSLLIQKQPGSDSVSLQSTIHIGQQREIVWRYPSTPLAQYSLTSDFYTSLLFKE